MNTQQNTNVMDTREYIRDNYERILAKAKTMKNFDEDVFQNTMLNIIINSEHLVESTIYNYIIHSLKINFLRELKYSRHNNTIICSYEDTCEPRVTIDDSLINDEIVKRYGQELADCYDIKNCGYTIKEIKEKYPHIKNLRNKILNIRNYISGIL